MYKAACLYVKLLLKLERKNKLPDAFVLSRSLDKNLHLLKKTRISQPNICCEYSNEPSQ